MQVVTLANKRTQHIPPVNYHAKSPMTFSYEACISTFGFYLGVTSSLTVIAHHVLRVFACTLQLSVGKAADTGWNWLSRMMGGGVEPPKLGL